MAPKPDAHIAVKQAAALEYDGCGYRQSPEGYSESTADSLRDTEAFIKWVQQLADDKIEAVVTPRFVPTCTPELLRGLGKLAADLDTPVQSHISESFDEVTCPTKQNDCAFALSAITPEAAHTQCNAS